MTLLFTKIIVISEHDISAHVGGGAVGGGGERSSYEVLGCDSENPHFTTYMAWLAR